MSEIKTSLTSGETIYLNEKPDTCPFCHEKTNPIVYIGHMIKDNIAELFMSCPNKKCRRTFIAIYSFNPNSIREFNFEGLSILQGLRIKQFNNVIINISPSFVSIYNQAFQAEQLGLTEICGVGYRKALEFLIKDYLISLYPDKEDVIKSKMLGPCINEFVTNIQIKTVVVRAVWIGNDETHYTRIWENKGIEDLKKLIDLSVHWIEMEVLTASFEIEMPKPSK